jgi:hypothetical protein
MLHINNTDVLIKKINKGEVKAYRKLAVILILEIGGSIVDIKILRFLSANMKQNKPY